MGFAFTQIQEEDYILQNQDVAPKSASRIFFANQSNQLEESNAQTKISTKKKQLITIKPCWMSPKYDYDYQGRRISKKVDGQTKQYVYDGFNLIAEYTDETLSKAHTWGMDLSGSMQGAGGVGGLLSTTEHLDANNEPLVSETRFYSVFDANGNVTEYLDSDGVVQAHYQYDEFGKTLASSGAKKEDFNFRFSTKLLDQESNLYYYGFRSYNPTTGKWLSRDPIGEVGHELLKLYSDSTVEFLISLREELNSLSASIEYKLKLASRGALSESAFDQLFDDLEYVIELSSYFDEYGTILPDSFENLENSYSFNNNNAISYIDPDGRWANFVIGALGGGLFDIGLQLLENGGRFDCLDYKSIAASVVAGAVGVGLVSKLSKINRINKALKAGKTTLGKTKTGGPRIKKEFPNGRKMDITDTRVKESTRKFLDKPTRDGKTFVDQKTSFKNAQSGSKGFKRDPTSTERGMLDRVR